MVGNEITLPIASDQDVIIARSKGRALAAELGFSPTDSTLIATAISELARNIVTYARRGEIVLGTAQDSGRAGVVVVARDNGPGIPSIDQALRNGYSTSGSLGLGLPGVRRLVDDFEINSEVGQGTTVTIRKWANNCHPSRTQARREPVELGLAALAIPGETTSGDRYVFEPFSDGFLVAAIDGIGHGAEAARAADSACAILKAHAAEPVVSLVERCHSSLRCTRGAAMSLAAFDVTHNLVTWLGVGNVEGVLQRYGASGNCAEESLLLRAGVVGSQLPPLRAMVLPVAWGDTLILTTDGVQSEFERATLSSMSPQRMAQHILSACSKGTDDALVLVARYCGGQT